MMNQATKQDMNKITGLVMKSRKTSNKHLLGVISASISTISRDTAPHSCLRYHADCARVPLSSSLGACLSDRASCSSHGPFQICLKCSKPQIRPIH